MTRVYHPYTSWEDYRAGMWSDDGPSDGVAEAVRILADPELFRAAAAEMVADWPTSAEQNLTAPASGRRSWIGQATCCHLAGVTETQTREAWWLLAPEEREIANAVADQVVAAWKEEGHRA